MKKRCAKCKNKKELKSYSNCKSRSDGKEPYCKECKSLYQKEKYKTGQICKETLKNNCLKYSLRNKLYVRMYLTQHNCVDCGETDPVVLEFDHINSETKLGEIGHFRSGSCSLKTLIEEIEKCEVRCSNCHTRRTANQQNWYAGLDGYVLEGEGFNLVAVASRR